MIFEFAGAPVLAASRETVWRHLQDGDAMAACTPGAESFEVLGPGRYSVRCSVGPGLVRVHVTLEAELHDLVHPDSLRLRASGAAPGSTLDVDTQVNLEALAPERTRLAWHSTTGVHGMLAKFGRGMVEDTLRQFTETFWANVAEQIAAAPRTGAYLVSPAELLALAPEALVGAVLLAGTDVEGGRLPKGHRLGDGDVAALRAVATGGSTDSFRMAWIGPHEMHEAEAATRIARAAAGPGLTIGRVHQGRVDLTARHRGVVTISLDGLDQINAIDPLELFTRWAHQPVEAGELVASAKAAPHVVEGRAILDGERIAAEHAPTIDVRPYVGVTMAGIVAEPLAAEARARFEAAARLRAESLGGRLVGVRYLGDGDEPGDAAAREALTELVIRQQVGVVLVGGVSAGDPLAPFFAALQELGGGLIRRGVPAHPGSMLWLGRLGSTQLLGVPRCGAFGMATAADLLLPRMMTGEMLTAESVAPLGHGGLLGREMRPRFPAYARELAEPPAS